MRRCQARCADLVEESAVPSSSSEASDCVSANALDKVELERLRLADSNDVHPASYGR